ncbi:hypothetical protein RRG08_064140 [Elysia crispata]|uniref:Uncharacterized protein n=1 Tax=Elysia crispata TaxID=231223 RepID=A0AAE1DIL6_9GAST|nr:hypothetical protein RRG08_064140 [Elysia crispata]
MRVSNDAGQIEEKSSFFLSHESYVDENCDMTSTTRSRRQDQIQGSLHMEAWVNLSVTGGRGLRPEREVAVYEYYGKGARKDEAVGKLHIGVCSSMSRDERAPQGEVICCSAWLICLLGARLCDLSVQRLYELNAGPGVSRRSHVIGDRCALDETLDLTKLEL